MKRTKSNLIKFAKRLDLSKDIQISLAEMIIKKHRFSANGHSGIDSDTGIALASNPTLCEEAQLILDKVETYRGKLQKNKNLCVSLKTKYHSITSISSLFSFLS